MNRRKGIETVGPRPVFCRLRSGIAFRLGPFAVSKTRDSYRGKDEWLPVKYRLRKVSRSYSDLSTLQQRFYEETALFRGVSLTVFSSNAKNGGFCSIKLD